MSEGSELGPVARNLNLDMLDSARRQLAETVTVKQATRIRDAAEGLRFYARSAKDRKMEAFAIEIRLRAERRAGEMLIEAAARGERRGRGGDQRSMSRASDVDLTPTIKEIGLTRNWSMYFRGKEMLLRRNISFLRPFFARRPSTLARGEDGCTRFRVSH